ncbi:hypothetical protein K7X08_031326 [Anisodus acutangulus]|uniref:Cyclin-like domain-containing protein n=1 Tax=Anisodus acutangulus TaxID=402998 RepID=A0A9Q1MPW3_9SOLA|nr:hypothetical protein K7X08_031326 [Anisodus acutangulus]
MKRKLHSESLQPAVKKQLRSKLPRRRRSHISPILRSFSNPNSSHLTSEVSRDSSKGSVNKREIKGDEFRRITRAYFRKNQKKDADVELSECSCVDSCSDVIGKTTKNEDPVNIEATEDSDAISRFPKASRSDVVEGNRNAKDIEGTEDSDAISMFPEASRSDVVEGNRSNAKDIEGTEDSDAISTFLKVSNDFYGKNSKSIVEGTAKINDEDNLVLQPPSESKCGNLSVKTIKCSENRDIESEVTRLSGATHAHDKLNRLAEINLECSENFSTIDISDDYSSAYSDIFPESSDIDLSDYSPSYWYDSGSQFSEKSNVDASPSPTFTLFLRFSQQFCRSTVALQSTRINLSDDHISTEFTGLEDEEDEESYKMIRNRERRQLYLHDYAEEYCSTTDYGDLIVQQRLHMVHWILEQATRRDLQKETMFLSVNLFDRFLSKGYFRTKRCLQIAGIACLTLAVRIEENQPHNSIRQKTFAVAGIAYSCSEVVSMEWLVQEVLNFQCLLPTIYNFLWFYLKAAGASEYVERTTKYLAVLALLGHEHLCYRPSTVASALVILALSAANLYASCHFVTKTHAKITDEDLPECIKSLEWLVKYI